MTKKKKKKKNKSSTHTRARARRIFFFFLPDKYFSLMPHTILYTYIYLYRIIATTRLVKSNSFPRITSSFRESLEYIDLIIYPARLKRTPARKPVSFFLISPWFFLSFSSSSSLATDYIIIIIIIRRRYRLQTNTRWWFFYFLVFLSFIGFVARTHRGQ